MKSIVLFVFLLFVQASLAQDTLIDGSAYLVKYFDSGEVSTLYPKLNPGASVHTGQTFAYNKNGEIIFEQNVRRIGGYSSVEYYYYSNGGIKQANYTSHPDGGIQRTDIRFTFDASGKLTGKADWSTDGLGGPKFLEDKLSDDSNASEKTQKVILLETTLIVVNGTKKKLKLLMSDLSTEDNLIEKVVLKKGDSLNLGAYITEGSFGNSMDRIILKSSKNGIELKLAELSKYPKPTSRVSTITITGILRQK